MNWRPLVISFGLVIACTSGAVGEKNSAATENDGEEHPACAVTDEDRRCTVDEDCEYLGTYVLSGECCYDPCGGGFAVNRQSIERLEAALKPLNEGPPKRPSACHDRSEVKCTYGSVQCVNGLCEQTHVSSLK